MTACQNPLNIRVLGRLKQIVFQPSEVGAIGGELSRVEDARIALLVLRGTVKVCLGVDGHEVHRPVLPAVPHAGHTVAFGGGHAPARVVGGEVGQRDAELPRLQYARGIVALRLVVARGDVIGHSGGEVLDPVHIAVVGRLVLELEQSLERVEHSIVGIAHIAHVEYHVDFSVVLPTLQDLARVCSGPVPGHGLVAQHPHGTGIAIHITHIAENCESNVALVVILWQRREG
mmetsp:Transcript_16291/g.32598  ORF Transcript_16291/g.32598 Transcript_16291/m.32598 type:complete len:231 (-) Transcript_16291:268-960(-)